MHFLNELIISVILLSEANIYTVTHLQGANCPHKMLVVSLKRNIFSIEHQDSEGALILTTRDVSVTYIT
jgi:hypothetical protein